MEELVTWEGVEDFLQAEHDLTREGSNDPRWDSYLCGDGSGYVDTALADAIRETVKAALEVVVAGIYSRMEES